MEIPIKTVVCLFFFNDTATTEIYTLSLHDALPISEHRHLRQVTDAGRVDAERGQRRDREHRGGPWRAVAHLRSEEHTSELQSRQYLVCRLLLEKKKNKIRITFILHIILADVFHT